MPDAPRTQRNVVFADLDRRYRRRVHAYALRMLDDAAEAEDVTQEVFLALHRGLHCFEGRSRLSTWIFGITRRQALRHLRKRRPWIALETAGCGDAPGEGAPADEVVDAARLLERCRRAVETKLSPGLREAMDRCARETAGMLATAGPPCRRSRDAMKMSLHRSRKALMRFVPGVGEFLGGR